MNGGAGTSGGSVTRTPVRQGTIGTRIPKGFGADLTIAWEVGDTVKHKSWGEGTILERTGEGEDLELTVEFAPPVGIRKLLAKFAPITKE